MSEVKRCPCGTCRYFIPYKYWDIDYLPDRVQHNFCPKCGVKLLPDGATGKHYAELEAEAVEADSGIAFACGHERIKDVLADMNITLNDADYADMVDALELWIGLNLKASIHHVITTMGYKQEAEVSDKQNIDTIQKQVTEWAKNNFGAYRLAPVEGE